MVSVEEQVEMLAFLRAEKERKRQGDPLHYYQLRAPDGSQSGATYEARQSIIAKLNEDRMFHFLRSQRERAEARAAKEAKKRGEAQIDAMIANLCRERALKARSAEVPLSAEKSGELQKFRESLPPLKDKRARPVETEEDEPAIVWRDVDYLWTRVINPVGQIVRMEEDQERYEHD